MKKNFDIFVLSNIDYRVLRSKGDMRSQVQQNLYLLGDFLPGLIFYKYYCDNKAL
jgi:hypothetical protein